MLRCDDAEAGARNFPKKDAEVLAMFELLPLAADACAMTRASFPARLSSIGRNRRTHYSGGLGKNIGRSVVTCHAFLLTLATLGQIIQLAQS